MSALVVRERVGGVRFNVRVLPRNARSTVWGVHAGVLKVKLQAAPVGGAANEELVTLLAEWLDVPARAVAIVRGAASRSKFVEVTGVSADRVRRCADDV
jgi:uncharacterized protein